MEIFETEREQIEALQRWWKENGKTVVFGLVVGLAVIVGWTTWRDYRQGQAEAASALYQRQAEAAAAGRHAEADELGRQILSDYGGSGYAPLAAMLLSKSAYEQDRPAEARRHLQWVLDHAAKQPELLLAARLNLARLALDSGDTAGALALLDVPEPGSFEGAIEELRGDALLAQGDAPGARAAYERALVALADSVALQRRVQLKLDDLGRLNVDDE